MPTIQKISGKFRFFFYSFDCNEPVHVHIQSENINPVSFCKNNGFAPKELNIIRKIIQENHATILEAWHEHCGTSD